MYTYIPTEVEDFFKNPQMSLPGNHFIVKNANEAFNHSTVAAYAAKFNGMLVHLGGGCKKLPDDDFERFVLYFLNIFAGCNKGLCSGGTTSINGGTRKVMITEIPPAVALANQAQYGWSNATLASFPRVDKFSFSEDGLSMDPYGTIANRTYGMNLAIQPDAFSGYMHENGEGIWDGDLVNKFDLYNELQKIGIKIPFMGANGGDVTRDEMLYGIQGGFDTFLVYGAAREVDELAKKYLKYIDTGDDEYFMHEFNADPTRSTIELLDYNNVETSRAILDEYGFYE